MGSVKKKPKTPKPSERVVHEDFAGVAGGLDEYHVDAAALAAAMGAAQAPTREPRERWLWPRFPRWGRK